MKICHIITRLILGGAQENTVLTCEGLHRRGHEVTLITGPAIGPEGELLTRAKAGGYRVVMLDAMRREIHPLRDYRTTRQLRILLCDLQPDIVHTHSSKAGVIGRKIAFQLRRKDRLPQNTKIVHTVHGLPYHPYLSVWKNRIYRSLETRAATRSDAILCVADAMTSQALAAGVGRPEQYTTVYSGMEVEPYLHRPAEADAFRASLNLPENAVLVTQVSRLAELKGHEYILDAAARLHDDRIVFCFVGDGHWRQRIEADIARRGLSDRFRLTGLLPPEQIPAVMHASDILIHCSLREGLARTLPQAMLAGRPVISYDVDGAREVVHESTGILLPPKNIRGLASGIQRLADNPALRDSMGQAGQQLCTTRFDWKTMVTQIETIYQRLRK